MTTAWRNRIVGTSLEPPDQLVANPRNWRTHPGRRCYAMEMEPAYCAVAIKRWEDFTGRVSERIDG